ncbi:MAG: translocation/assembly module TamB [Hymenobacteraceae bacterium]|nr:translocation/assembly module TamB [Hymenobacteraceae bacterium]
MLVLLLVGGLMVAIRFPAVQTKVAQKAAEIISETIDHQVTIGSVDIDFFSSVILDSVQVLDYKDQELFYIGNVEADISAFSIFHPNKLTIDKLTLTEPHFQLVQYAGSDSLNLSTFIRSLKNLIKSDTARASKPFEFKINEIQINNGYFVYDNQNKPYQEYGLDYQHMQLDSIYGNLSDIDLNGDTINAQITGLHTKDRRSGVHLKHLDVDMTYAPTFWEYKDMNLRVNKSNLRNYVRFDYKHFGNFTSFIDSVHVTADLDSSYVRGRDVAMFAPQIRDLIEKEEVLFTGKINGKVKNFNAKDVDIYYGNKTHIVGNVGANGLPNIKETFIELKLQPSTLYAPDLKQYIPADAYAYANRLGIVKLRGQFIGFYNDFVANGSFATALGNLQSDINLKLEKNQKYSSYRGFLRTDNFNVGKLIDNTEVIKTITMNGRVEGTGFSLQDARLKLDATIGAIHVYDYNYQNITTNATLSSQTFQGDIKINDPNLQFTASGTVDLSNNNQVFDLTADLQKADLQALKFSTDNFVIETDAKLDFTGIKLDDIRGTAAFNNSVVTYKDKQLQLDTISIESNVENGIRTLDLNSELLNFKATGTFSYAQLINDVERLLTEYQLNFENNEQKIASYYRNKPQQDIPEYTVQYDLRLKDVNPLVQLFVPQLTVSENAKIEGEFRSGNTYIFNLAGHFDTLVYDNVKLFNNNLEASFSKLPYNSEVLATAFFTSQNQKLPSVGETEGFYVEGVWNERTIAFSTNLAQSGTTNRATISGNLNFLTDNLEIVFNRSNINILDKEWHISQNNTVVIDGKTVEFINFSLSHKYQSINIKGFISPDPAKTVQVDVVNFQLQNLNPLLDEKLKGVLNANVNARDLYEQAMVSSRLRIDSLHFGDILIGDVVGDTDWDNRLSRMDVNIGINRDNIKKLSVTGYYNPQGGDEQLNLLAVMDGAEIKLVEPLLKDIIHDMSGTMAGRVRILGKLTAPVLKGNVLVSNGKFNFTYLNTVYTFSDRVYFSENGITFRSLNLRDVYGNQGTLNGGVYHDGFQNMLIDLKATFNKLMVLNTTREENELFYGSAFASGSASVFGPPNDLKVNVTATSEKGTRMFIPLDNQAELTRQNYIRFVNRNTADSTKVQVEATEQRVDLSGISLNFDLTVTEDAYAEIIFDERAGDIIRGVGNGRLRLNIDTRGEFNMYGQYEITRGAYNFTLYGLVNREFDIRSGSTISWNGDPYAGILNVTASYTQRATLPFLSNYSAVDQEATPVSVRYPVTVVMDLEGNLMAPQIKLSMEFDDVPGTLQDQVNAYMTSIRNDEQELNRQVFSLLVFKRLSPPGEFDFQNAGGGALGSLSDVLSGQLSAWISQVDRNLEIDIGVEGLTEEQARDLQLRIGYSFLGGRLRVTREGGINTGSTPPGSTGSYNQNSVVGDWTVEYYLRPDGKLRLRLEYETQQQAFQTFERTNSVRSSVSLIHTESFDSFGDLFGSFARLFTSKRSREEAAELEKEKIIIDSDPRLHLLNKEN